MYGAGSEDMDTLTFGSPILLRHLTFSENRKLPINVISLADVLEGLDLSMDRFIDVCLLAGCDYLEPLKKVGAKTALKLIREHETIDQALEHLAEKSKNPPPEDWPWEAAKELFKHPDVTPCSEITVRGRRANRLIDRSSSGRSRMSRASSTSSCATRASSASAWLRPRLTRQRGTCPQGCRQASHRHVRQAAGPSGRLLQVCRAIERRQSVRPGLRTSADFPG